MKTKEDFKQSLGANLRRERLRRSFTVEQLALECGLPYSQISRIELGRRNATAFTIYVISHTLNVCPSILFDVGSADGHSESSVVS